jgi:hypothetical protein
MAARITNGLRQYAPHPDPLPTRLAIIMRGWLVGWLRSNEVLAACDVLEHFTHMSDVFMGPTKEFAPLLYTFG